MNWLHFKCILRAPKVRVFFSKNSYSNYEDAYMGYRLMRIEKLAMILDLSNLHDSSNKVPQVLGYESLILIKRFDGD